MSTKNMPRGFKIATGNNKRPRWREQERQEKAVIERHCLYSSVGEPG